MKIFDAIAAVAYPRLSPRIAFGRFGLWILAGASRWHYRDHPPLPAEDFKEDGVPF